MRKLLPKKQDHLMNKYNKEKKLTTDKLSTLAVFDRDLELDTLACIVYNTNNYSKVMLLEEDDFYVLENKELFQAIRDCYKKEKVINLPTLSQSVKKYEGFLKLAGIRDYVITSQVTINIKKLKGLKASRKIQDLSYQATLKTQQGDNPLEIKSWLGRGIEKINSDYEKKEITISELEDSFDKMINQADADPITSGFPRLDRKMGGFEKGKMTIIAAAQGVGKTTMALNLLHHFCGKLDKTVLYVSLEMTFKTLYLMSVSRASGVPYFKIMYRRDEISDGEWAAINNARAKVSQFKQIRMGEEEISTDDIKYKIKEENPDIVIIDYLQRIKSRQRFTNEYEKLTNISNELATLKNELDVPLIVIASINRKYADRDDKTPRVSDIRGSGTIEYDADTVLLLHRDSAFGAYTGTGDKNKYNHGGKLYIAKQRFGESNKMIDIYFDGAKVLMREMEHEDEIHR